MEADRKGRKGEEGRGGGEGGVKKRGVRRKSVTNVKGEIQLRIFFFCLKRFESEKNWKDKLRKASE